MNVVEVRKALGSFKASLGDGSHMYRPFATRTLRRRRIMSPDDERGFATVSCWRGAFVAINGLCNFDQTCARYDSEKLTWLWILVCQCASRGSCSGRLTCLHGVPSMTRGSRSGISMHDWLAFINCFVLLWYSLNFTLRKQYGFYYISMSKTCKLERTKEIMKHMEECV